MKTHRLIKSENEKKKQLKTKNDCKKIAIKIKTFFNETDELRSKFQVGSIQHNRQHSFLLLEEKGMVLYKNKIHKYSSFKIVR